MVPHICHHCHYKGGHMMLVASANACQGWRSLHVPLPLHQQCSTRAGG